VLQTVILNTPLLVQWKVLDQPTRESTEGWISPLEKALKGHVLGSGNAMVLQWYHHQPREFCWGDADISI